VKDDTCCLGKTPGYARYSGYDTPEEEARYLPVLGPVWKDGDPIPPEHCGSTTKKPVKEEIAA
jgi:hypothetical protein